MAAKEPPKPAHATVSQHLLAWYDRYGRMDLPWRRDWAAFADPYRVWLSEVMLQQTQIQSVIPAYERFVSRWPNASLAAAAPLQAILNECQGLGYYRRFRLFHEALQKVAGKWPTSAAAWRQLPGIGRYTASALASITNNEPTPVFDGNVARVMARVLGDPQLVYGQPSDSQRRAEATLQSWIDRGRPGDFNQALMEVGQTLCRPEAWTCDPCPLSRDCTSRQLGLQGQVPRPRTRAAIKAVDLWAVVPCRMATKREVEVGLVQRDAQAPFLRGTRGVVLTKRRPEEDHVFLPNSVRHQITHHDLRIVPVISLHTCDMSVTWISLSRAAREIVTSLDRKVLSTVGAYLDSAKGLEGIRSK